MRCTKAVTLALACVAIALLNGCEPQVGAAAMEEYLARIANTLDMKPPEPEAVAVPPLPARRELRIELVSGGIDTLDFLALTGCEVQITIGRRNSSLGRMASASQRLLLELEYLRLAPACIDHLRREGNEELARILSEARTMKQVQLPALIFNATLGGPEFRTFWQAPARLGDYPARTSSVPVTALEALASLAERWLGGDYRADNTAFELLLRDVALGDGGRLLTALARQANSLKQANDLLADHAAGGPLCRPRIRPAAADILPNVVRKFFVAGVQTWSADIARRQYALMPPLRRLETLLDDALPTSYRDWLRERELALERWREAPAAHVRKLQEFLSPCGDAGIAPRVAGGNPGSGGHQAMARNSSISRLGCDSCVSSLRGSVSLTRKSE